MTLNSVLDSASAWNLLAFGLLLAGPLITLGAISTLTGVGGEILVHAKILRPVDTRLTDPNTVISITYHAPMVIGGIIPLIERRLGVSCSHKDVLCPASIKTLSFRT
jgi:hypothetical protein